MKIFVKNLQRHLPVNSRRIARLAETVLRSERHTRWNLSFVFVDNRAIRAVNKRFLKHDYATDVIAFDLGPDLIERRVHTGEVIVSTQMAIQEAKKRKISPREEFTRYCIHGILHLLGYEDKSSRAFKRMWARQEALLERFLER